MEKVERDNTSFYICPKCGASSNDKEFIDAFCTGCYEFNVKMPKEIVLTQCTRCKKIKIKTDWKNPTPKQISEYVSSKCRGDFTSAEFDVSSKIMKFTLERDGKKVNINKELAFEIEKTICTDCSRLAGGYYEAILQIRSEDGERVESKAQKLFEQLKKKTFVSKIVEMHGGLDMYVGSTKVVFSTLQDLKIKPGKITRKLSGRREGKKIYRTSFAIRL